MHMRAWRWWLALRFRLFQRHRYNTTVLEWVDGCPLAVLPEVFNPGIFPTGRLLARQIRAHLTPGAAVLDMGTGSGIGAVFAARAGAEHVVAVDINPQAVRCASINALLNHVEDRVQVCAGDLFAPVAGQRFDLVLFNPPYYRGTAQTPLDHAWRSEDTVERFAAALAAHLTPTGCALVVLSTNGDEAAFLHAFAAHALHTEIAAQTHLISEVVTIYRLRVKQSEAAP